MDGMGKAVCVYGNVAFNTRNLFARVIPLFFSCIGILYALSVNDVETRVFVPSIACSNLANQFFLRLSPRGLGRPLSFHSIQRSNSRRVASAENLRESCSMGS